MMNSVLFTLNKAFSLLFIFTITAVNLWLVGNFLYWKNIFSIDKKCIISSLVISDVLIGLFCLTVEASLYFEIYLGGPGCVLSYVQVYSQFFAPFVYGTGISILAIELILKERGRSFYEWSKFLTLFISLLPWLLAVVIVLPLTFAGRSADSCWYLPQNIHGICIWAVPTLLPVVTSLALWTFSAFVKWNDRSDMTCSTCKSISKDLTQTGGASQSLLMEGERTEGDHPQRRSADMETSIDTDNSSSPQANVFIAATETAGSPSSLQAGNGSQQFIAHTSPQTCRLGDQTGGGGCTETKRGQEKIHLLLIILIFITLTVPFSLYNLMKVASYLYGSGTLMSDETLFVLKWMESSRSVLIPFAWSVIFYIEKNKITWY